MNDTAIVIGTYNRAHLLRRSLLHYSKDVDLYILDDGSTDNTSRICLLHAMQHSNIDYVYLNGVKRDGAIVQVI